MHAPARHDRASPRPGPSFGREARRVAAAWLALLALMALSLGSAFVALGAGNLAVSLAIAAVKAGLVAWIFMQLKRAPPVTRIAALAGLLFLALLMALSGFDYATRHLAPAPWQVPQQVVPALGQSPRSRRRRRARPVGAAVAGAERV
jgi:cytochrome c oxidase subunit 4